MYNSIDCVSDIVYAIAENVTEVILEKIDNREKSTVINVDDIVEIIS
jgi:hypothetical protein